MPFKFIEDKYIADYAFEVEAENFEELLKDACKALELVQVVDLSKVEKKEVREFSIEAENEEQAVFNLLNELIFYKDSELLIFSEFELKVEKNEKIKIFCKFSGEKLDYEKHETKIDVKAVTYHDFKVEFKNNKWYAHVVLDV